MNSTPDPDRLYRLLPSIYATRDAENGYALQALCRLLGREAQLLEDDLYGMYDGWFIETCAEWIVPYIGDLVGFAPSAQAGDPANVDVSDVAGRAKVLVPRRDVANTVHDRRRKGTLALLEAIARDAAGWPAHAFEFFRALGWTQNVNHVYPERGGTADVRAGLLLAGIDGPFDRLAHTVDIRRPDSTLTTGRYDVPSVGMFAWRLRPFTVTHSRAYCLERVGRQYYTFAALGTNTPLFNLPRARTDDSAPRSALELPSRVSRRAFEERVAPAQGGECRDGGPSIASADYYGIDRGLAIWAPEWPTKDAPQPIPRDAIIPSDLSDWKRRVPEGFVAVDPELGRIAFPSRHPPPQSVYVSYVYGFAAAIGGGEYSRPLLESPGAVVYRVGQERPDLDDSIGAALERWRTMSPRPPSAVVEIIDSGVYTEPLAVELDEGESLQVRAANRTRPIIRLLDYLVDQPDPFSVRGKRGSRFVLDGLLVTGRGIAVRGPDPREDPADDGDLCEVIIRHCTLVPGWGLDCDCAPDRPEEPSVDITNSRARVAIEHSIVGSIVVDNDEVRTDPIRLEISDSIVDATSLVGDGPQAQALTASNAQCALVQATVLRSTVFGRVSVHSIELAENSIFASPVVVARRQRGCMRFCYVAPPSRTPPRYECQPDKATAGLAGDDATLEALRVAPQFMSTRYGNPNYARLADEGPVELARGADDQSEMGVYHDLYDPQRRALLRQRLDEYVPADMAPGLIFVT